MPAKRYRKVESITDEDYKRNCRNLKSRYGSKIQDKKSFEKYFDIYFNKNETQHIKQDERWKAEVYRYWSGEKQASPAETGLSRQEQKLFRERSGRETFEGPVKRRIVRERTAARPTAKKEYLYVYLGTQKGQKNYARRINTQKGVRYIDNRGRFVSVKKK